MWVGTWARAPASNASGTLARAVQAFSGAPVANSAETAGGAEWRAMGPREPFLSISHTAAHAALAEMGPERCDQTRIARGAEKGASRQGLFGLHGVRARSTSARVQAKGNPRGSRAWSQCGGPRPAEGGAELMRAGDPPTGVRRR